MVDKERSDVVLKKLDAIVVGTSKREADRELKSIVGSHVRVQDESPDLKRYFAKKFSEGKLILEPADPGSRYYEGIEITFRAESPTKLVKRYNDICSKVKREEQAIVYRCP